MGFAGLTTKRRVEISPLRTSPLPLLQQPPPPQFSNAVYRAILLAAAIGLMYIVLDQSNFSPPSSPADSTVSLERESEASSFHVFKSVDLTSKKKQNDRNKLEMLLEKASIKDRKTVIITTVNAAWMEPSSLFDLFLESFKIGNGTQKLIENLVVVAMDREAYDRCSSLGLHCYALVTEGVDFSGEAKFRSSDFMKMTWARVEFMGSVLELGYNFIFSDTDIAWFRDPFERLDPDAEFQISCDVYINNATSRNNYVNTGIEYAKSSPRTIMLYKHWLNKGRRFPETSEQDVFYQIKGGSFLDEIGLEVRYLDTAYFSGLCEPAEDLEAVVTMHANCCTTLKSKLHDLAMVIEDWKTYKNNNYNMGGGDDNKVKWTLPRQCGARKSLVEEMKARALA